MAADRYRSYESLAREERLGVDYRLEQRFADPSVLVLAIHGGPIERHTDVIADRVAREDFSYYALIGMRRRHNKEHLHVASERFREPMAMQLVTRAQLVVSIHGEANDVGAYVMMGGLDDALREAIRVRLERAHFDLKLAPRHLAATDPCNICNCGPRGAGAQLEISMALRKSLHADPDRMDTFTMAIREALFERKAALLR